MLKEFNFFWEWMFGAGSKGAKKRNAFLILIDPFLFEGIRTTYREGTQHIIDLLRELAREGSIDIADQYESPYGDYFIVREQNGPLGSQKIQLIVFRSYSRKIYYVAHASKRWTRYISAETLEQLGSKFARVEQSQE